MPAGIWAEDGLWAGEASRLLVPLVFGERCAISRALTVDVRLTRPTEHNHESYNTRYMSGLWHMEWAEEAS